MTGGAPSAYANYLLDFWCGNVPCDWQVLKHYERLLTRTVW